jgi:hypothetical protein
VRATWWSSWWTSGTNSSDAAVSLSDQRTSRRVIRLEGARDRFRPGCADHTLQLDDLKKDWPDGALTVLTGGLRVLYRGESMTMKRRFLTTALLIACASTSAAGGGAVSFQATDSGRFFVSPTGDPSVVLTQDFANGQSAHLGNYNLVAHEHVNLTTLEIIDGAFAITTEKGDTIHGEYSGSGAATRTDGVITCLVTGRITRGSGRFAGSDGSVTFSGVADLRTGVSSEIITGQLSARRPHVDR